MGDVGHKIAKSGASVRSTTPRDYDFWSKYQSLPFLFKVTLTQTVDSGNCTGTIVYNHNLGFAPFVMARANSIVNGGVFSLPLTFLSDGDKTLCSSNNFVESLSYQVKENTVEISYDAECFIPMFSSRCIDVSRTYTIDLFFYMFELGSAE